MYEYEWVAWLRHAAGSKLYGTDQKVELIHESSLSYILFRFVDADDEKYGADQIEIGSEAPYQNADCSRWRGQAIIKK